MNDATRSGRTLATAILATGLAACSPGNEPPLAVADDFRVDRYAGRWHEIATIPASFQDDCTGSATAEYARVGDRVAVVNRCPTGAGKIKVADGMARFVERPTLGKLEVTFVQLGDWWLWPAAGRYWIVALDPAYRWSVVGEPGRDYAWILSRTPSLPADTLARLSGVLRDAGYDPCALVVTFLR